MGRAFALVAPISCSVKRGALTGVCSTETIDGDPINELTGGAVKLTKVGDGCEDGTCPTVWAIADSGDVVVQGYVVDDAEALDTMALPKTETAVRIPLALLQRVAREYPA